MGKHKSEVAFDMAYAWFDADDSHSAWYCTPAHKLFYNTERVYLVRVAQPGPMDDPFELRRYSDDRYLGGANTKDEAQRDGCHALCQLEPSEFASTICAADYGAAYLFGKSVVLDRQGIIAINASTLLKESRIMERTTVGRFKDAILTAGAIDGATGKQIFGLFTDEMEARNQHADDLCVGTVGRESLSPEQIELADRNSASM